MAILQKLLSYCQFHLDCTYVKSTAMGNTMLATECPYFGELCRLAAQILLKDNTTNAMLVVYS